MWGKKVPYVCFCEILVVLTLFSFLLSHFPKSHLQLYKFCQLVPSSFVLLSKKRKGWWANDNCSSYFPLLCFAAAEKNSFTCPRFLPQKLTTTLKGAALYNKATRMRLGPDLRDKTLSLCRASASDRFRGQNVGCSR